MPPTSESLSNLLDQEIEYAHAEEQRGGWTTWAVAGALAGAALLFVDRWDDAPFQAELLARWIVLLSIPVEAITAWLASWAYYDSPQDSRRYRYAKEFGTQLPAQVWRSLYTGFVGYLAIYSGGDVWQPVVVLVALWYGMISLFSLFAAIFTLFEWPYRLSHRPAMMAGVIAVMLALPFIVVTMIGYAQAVPAIQPGRIDLEIQLAALTVVTTRLIFWLLWSIRRPWAVGHLIQIRRHFALGTIDLDVAARRTGIVLLGMEANTALEEHLLKTLDRHQEISEFCAMALAQLEQQAQATAALETKAGTLEDAQLSEQLSDLIDSLKVPKRHLKYLRKEQQRIVKRMRSLQRLGQMMHREHPVVLARASTALAQLSSLVEERNQQLDQAIVSYSAALAELHDRCSQLDPGKRKS